jgi:antirestriction protein ArdC
MDRSNDIYQKVTDQIIAELENGNVPWIRPWRDGEPPFPINALSGRPYHGINVPLLWNSADKQSFASDRWLTFHQVSALGGQVRRGEKSSLAVLYLPRTQEETDALGQPLLDKTASRRYGISGSSASSGCLTCRSATACRSRCLSRLPGPQSLWRWPKPLRRIAA